MIGDVDRICCKLCKIKMCGIVAVKSDKKSVVVWHRARQRRANGDLR